MGRFKPLHKAFLATLNAIAAARAIDLALVGSSIGAAVGTVAFAGYMVARGDHAPRINGIEYLAIFGKPSAGHGVDPDANGIDMAPIGAVAPSNPIATSGYSLVAAQADLAWLREGSRIFAVKPGQSVPRLGLIASIAKSKDRWTLLDAAGVPLILGARVELSTTASSPFARPMIFGERK